MLGPLALVASLLLALADTDGSALASREVEFPFDDEARLLPGESHGGKVWRSHGVPGGGSPVPVVVFVHGIIFDGLRHHWLTHDSNAPADLRPWLDGLVDAGYVSPLVAAVPSQTRDATDPSKLFVELDFDRFVDAVDAALAPHQRVDRSRVIVVGHSAAACDPRGASFASLGARTFRPWALIAIDGCMSESSATLLAATDRAANVIVTYQNVLWERPFADFEEAWERTRLTTWPPGLRALERVGASGENAHIAIVEATLDRWLPILLPPTRPRTWISALAVATAAPR